MIFDLDYTIGNKFNGVGEVKIYWMKKNYPSNLFVGLLKIL